MKKLISLFFIITSIGFCLGIEVNLSLNKKTIDINNPLKLKLSIKNDTSTPVSIQEIKGLDKFDIIGQNSFQSISTEIKIINGQQQSQTITNQNLLLILQAKKTGDYTLGPAVVKIGDKTYKSNSVKVKITGAKIMVNNSQLSNQNNQTQKQVDTKVLSGTKQTSSKEENNNAMLSVILNSERFLISMFLSFLFLIGVVAIRKSINDIKNKSNTDETEATDVEEGYIKIKNNEKNIIEKSRNKGPLGFLTKYGIQEPETKTYSEIMKEIKEKNIKLSGREEEIIKTYLIESFKK